MARTKVIPLRAEQPTVPKVEDADVTLLTKAQVQQKLQVGRDRLEEMIRRGDLAIVRLPGKQREVRVKMSALAAWINAHEVPARSGE